MGDLRTKRTYQFLKNALLELLTKKPFEEIKVNDICNLAMVHRTTFYSHFADKYELLNYCIEDVEQEITEKIRNQDYHDSKEFYRHMIMTLLMYIQENRRLFRSLLKKNTDRGIVLIFKDACATFISQMLEKEEDSGVVHHVPVTIMAEFYSGAVMDTIAWWIKTDSDMSEKEVCEYIITLIFDIVPHQST